MADDVSGEQPQNDGAAGGGAAAGAAPQPASVPDPEREADRRKIESLEQQIGNLNGTLAALSNLGLNPQQQQAPQQGGPIYIPPNVRAKLRQEGLSDQEIDANGPLIVPFLRAIAPEITGPLQGLSSKVELLQAEREFPYWDTLKDDALKLRDEAGRQGYNVTLWDAYKEAAVRNPEKIAEAVTAQKSAAASRAKDATAMGSMGGSRAYTRDDGSGGKLTGESVRAMSREDRNKLWEELGG